MADNILNKISQLPEDIQDYLFSEEIVKRNLEIINKYRFFQKEKGAYFNIINKIFLKELSFSSLPAVLMSDLKIKEDKIIKQLAQDIKEIVLSPVKEYLGLDGDGKQRGYEENILIEKAIKKFNLFSSAVPPPFKGGDGGGEDTDLTRPLLGKERREQTSPNLSLTKEREEKLKKFSEMADTFLSGVRTKAQFKNTLTKPIADGGLQMAHQLADDVAEFLASYLRIGEIEKKKEKSPPTPLLQRGEKTEPHPPSPFKGEELPKFPPSEKGDRGGFINPPQPSLSEGGSSHLVPPNVKIEVDFSREEKEAAAKKPKIEKMRLAAPKLLSVTEGVTKALAELNYTFPSSELQERLKSVIDARVRNVRNSIQTFDKLTQDIPSGGMGFSKLEADKVSLVLNKYLEDKNKDIYSSKLAEIKQAEDEEKKKNQERARAAEDAEKKNLDERFTKLTGKEGKTMTMTMTMTPPALTKSEITEKKQAKSPPKIPLNPSFSKGEEDLQRGEEEGIPPPLEKEGGLPREAQGAKWGGGFVPAPSPVQSSKFKVQSSSLPPRPVLEDIKYTPKLAGPTEEIARLTLEDFRKLSGDPKEAVLKIKDKLALLREESYKKYQAGIDAWQKSPLYGEYLKVMSQSLTAGAPLSDVLKGGQTLTQDEFDAIINSKVGD